MTNFSDLNVSDNILRACTREGYSTPTPIQAQVIPTMIAGHDILGLAQTGTGKTAAFVLPILHRIDQSLPRMEHKCASTLILAPTRELASQIAESIRTYGRFIQHSLAVIVGGMKMGPQIKTLARGNDIIVATPGRLLDHLQSGHVRLDLTTTLILDEADQMLDMGFIPSIRKIVSMMPKQRQTALLSATMPRQIKALAQDLLNNPREISVAPSARPIERITQKVILTKTADKATLLTQLLGEEDLTRAVIFTRTKRGADKLARFLEKSDFSAEAIHGDKNQRQRDRALKAFRSGKTPLLIATDIAARGIDIDDVSHVINYDVPLMAEAYVHRIGRTARAGKSGTAISLCNSEERLLIRDIERVIGKAIDKFDGETGEAVQEELLPALPNPKRSSKRRKGPPRHNAKRNRPQNQPNPQKKPKSARRKAAG